MTSRQLADSPFLQNASEKFKTLAETVARMPLALWRNLVLVLIFIWMCHSGASLFWALMPTPDIPQPAVIATPASVDGAAGSANVDVAAIQAQNLFGIAGATQGPISQDVAAAPVIGEDIETTKLNLTLSAVLASEDTNAARAVIADGNDQSLYSVGEQVGKNAGVKLAKVLTDRVILDNKGNHEALWLYSEEDYKSTPKATYTERAPASVPMSRQTGPEEGKQVVVKQDQIPTSINDVIRFSVYREDGKMLGYRVRYGRERELFDQVGLKMNDIVTSVNGIRVDDPKQIRMVYQSLKTATSAQLEVMRDGETSIINISLDSGG